MTEEIIEKIERLMSKQDRVVIAIEGMCAAGKTTLAKEIHKRFHGAIIPVDDFFLPSELRTKERYLESAGNIHYERFIEEVMIPILEKREIKYRKFDCKKMEYTIQKEVPVTSLYIVEGSYCMRKEFRKMYDLTIFLSCGEKEQARRILKRNGKLQAEVFRERWIPMENRYFEKEKIKEKCDILKITGE